MRNPNPLRSAPFFTIPGINPDDPIRQALIPEHFALEHPADLAFLTLIDNSAQMEQIDQLNTLLLQDIDHNFARFHQVVTSKLLPEIKRFALASEPTREASRFWRSFFEAAASVKVPVPGEITRTESDHSLLSAERYTDQETSIDGSISSEDRSFLYGSQAASTSTPNNRVPHGHDPGMSGGTWASSVDSPFEQLDRKLRDDLNLGGSGSSAIGSGLESDSSSMGTPTPLPSGYGREDGSGTGSYDEYDEEPSVLLERRDGSRNDREDSYALADEDDGQDGAATPVAPRAAERHPSSIPRQPMLQSHSRSMKSPHRHANPFAFSETSTTSSSASPWNGVVDLRNSPLNPKIKSASRYPLENSLNISPAPPAFSSPARTLRKTPRKDAAQLIMDDMLKELGGLTASPGLPTPPAFSKYAALENTPMKAAAVRRNLFDDGPEGSVIASGSSVREGSSLARNVYSAGDQEEGDMTYRPADQQEDELTSSQVGRTDHYKSGVHPLDADGDDSFDTYAGVPEGYEDDAPQSSSSAAGRRNAPRDSFGNDTSLDTIQPNRYRQAHNSSMTGSSDSMSPATSEAARVFGGTTGGRGKGGNLFSLHGPDEIHTFHGGRLEDGVSSPKDSPSYGYGLAKMQSRGATGGRL